MVDVRNPGGGFTGEMAAISCGKSPKIASPITFKAAFVTSAADSFAGSGGMVNDLPNAASGCGGSLMTGVTRADHSRALVPCPSTSGDVFSLFVLTVHWFFAKQTGISDRR
jgi:hypothetical protein